LNGRIYNDVIFTNPAAIQIIVDENCRQLSIGYSTKTKKLCGTYEGIAFDRLDTELEINHLALVIAGDLGAECTL
jgi:hypothetical protein